MENDAKKTRRGRPSEMRDRAVVIKFTAEEIERIDDWCARQHAHPARTVAIRTAVERMIAAQPVDGAR